MTGTLIHAYFLLPFWTCQVSQHDLIQIIQTQSPSVNKISLHRYFQELLHTSILAMAIDMVLLSGW